MTSALQRFRERELRPLVLSVPWPSADKPEFIFEVGVFSQAEKNVAEDEAEGVIRRRGVETPGVDATKDEWREFNKHLTIAAWYRLAPIVQRHVRGWKFVGEGEEVKYSVGNAATIFAGMNRDEMALLGHAYEEALKEAEAKKAAPPTKEGTDGSSAPSSSTDSEGGSAT